jgi:hypothetical protein
VVTDAEPEKDSLGWQSFIRWPQWLPPRYRSVVAATIVYGGLTLLAVLAAPLVDGVGGTALDASFKRALAALAATRGLDAAISLAQSSEVSFSFGPGGSLGIGQVLDPVNDLIEQYGGLLLTSTTALGIQQMAMRMGRALGWWLFVPALVTIAVATTAAGPLRTRLAGWGRRLFFLAVFVRFAIPVTAWIDAAIAKRFLESDYLEAVAVVESTTQSLQQAEAADTERPWYERYNPVNVVGDRAKHVYDMLGDVGESVVNLAIYFTIATIVLPLVTLWLLSKVLTVLASPREA